MLSLAIVFFPNDWLTAIITRTFFVAFPSFAAAGPRPVPTKNPPRSENLLITAQNLRFKQRDAYVMDSDGIISGNHRSIEGVRSAGLSMRLSYETLFCNFATVNRDREQRWGVLSE